MKLTKIELKKYFKNPATYIISALLVLVISAPWMIDIFKSSTEEMFGYIKAFIGS